MKINLKRWDIQAKIFQVKLSGRIFRAHDDGELYEIIPNIPASYYVEDPPDDDGLPNGMMFYQEPQPRHVLMITVRNILSNERRRVDVTQIKLWDTLTEDETARPAQTNEEATRLALTWYSRYGTRGEKTKANRALKNKPKPRPNEWVKPWGSGIMYKDNNYGLLGPPDMS